MQAIEIIAQGIGILAMAFNILSYQQKTKRGVLLFQLCGASLFAVNFLLIGSYVGAALNVIAALRAVVYFYHRRFRAEHVGWLLLFPLLCVLMYVLNFTVLGGVCDAHHLVIELLPVIGMTASTIGYRLSGAKAVRLLGLVSSPAWLVYNISVFSVGAIFCESFSLVSILIGILRYDVKPTRRPRGE